MNIFMGERHFMKKLLTLVLLLMVSSVWAQEGTLTPSAPAVASSTALETPIANMTVVVQNNSWGSSGMPVASPQTTVGNSGMSSSPTPSRTVVSSSMAVQVSETAVVGTPVAGTVSASATPSGTPSILPKPPVMAVATPVLSSPVGEHFVFQFDGGAVVPVSNAAATYFSTGYGLDARIGYAFDDVFSIGLETGFYNLGVPAASLKNSGIPATAMASMSHIPALFTMQIYFGDSGAPIQPYLLLAGGLAFDSNNLQGASFPVTAVTSWTNFEFDPAAGVAFRLDKNTNVFLQVKCAMDFDDYNSTDAAVQSGDTPLILVPIQVGASFSL
jgi:outer membrane protein W